MRGILFSNIFSRELFVMQVEVESILVCGILRSADYHEWIESIARPRQVVPGQKCTQWLRLYSLQAQLGLDRRIIILYCNLY